MSSAPARVSVIVPTHGRPALLADALRSVAAQSAPPFELIVGDDGDDALDEALAAAHPLPTRRVPSERRQLAATRNLAARAAGGEWLAFLDDDDRWTADHLAGLAPALADPATAFVYRDSVVIQERLDPAGARIECDRRVIARDWDPPLMRHHDYLPPSAWAIRRDAFEALGGFDESLRFSEDWDLLLRLARSVTPRRVPGVTVEVRMRESGHLSGDRGAERQACLDLLSSRHGLPALTIKTFWEVADVVARAGGGA